MMNGETTNDSQMSNTYLDNVIKQLEISDGSQATSCVRFAFFCSRRFFRNSSFSSLVDPFLFEMMPEHF